MTDDHDTAHLDDELLSAVLDGEADVDASAHTDSCDRCRTRLATLRDVSVLVAAPVPVADPAQRDAAIATALSAVDRIVVPMRQRRLPPAWLAAAAAVVVAVGAIALISRGADDEGAGFDTAADDADEATGGEGASELDTFSAAPVAPIDGGDLGEVDEATLRHAIEAAVGGQRNAGAAARQEEVADAPAAMPASVPVPCEEDVRAGNPELGPLVYRANGTIDGVPVIVLAFDVPPDRWVYVATVDGCAIRNQQTYSP